MIKFLASSNRGHANHGWLKSHHSFSFANYVNPEYMGFKSLRVINEDYIAGGGGFPTHPHKNMEIITVVLSGALEHKDSLGTQSIIKPGEVQKMSAGSGIEHSEFNHFKDQETHLLQIWIIPNRAVETSYQQIDFSKSYNSQALTLICSPDGKDKSISIAQNASMFMANLKENETLNYEIVPGHDIWIQQISGDAVVNNQTLNDGDALALVSEKKITARAISKSKFLIFDLF